MNNMNEDLDMQPIKTCGCLRYVGVVWLIFHVLQLLLIRFTQQNSCCISMYTMKHMQKPDLP